MPQNVDRLKQRFLGGATIYLPLRAGENLSAQQYRFVVPGSVVGEVKLATGASNPMPIGVLQNAPTVCQVAQVAVYGLATVAGQPSGCILINGTFITSSSIGTACAAGSGGVVLARWLDATASAVGTVVNGNAFLFGGLGSACIGSAS